MHFNYLRQSWDIYRNLTLAWKAGEMPLDYHVCGFNRDLCIESRSAFLAGAVAPVVGALVALFTGIGFGLW